MHLNSTTTSSRAFTLIEMLASVSMLVAVVVIITQSLALTSETITRGKQKMGSQREAELFFSLFERDLSAKPQHQDLPVDFEKKPGNDHLLFYTEKNSTEESRRYAWIEYRIQNTTFNKYPSLTRGERRCDWSSANALRFLPSKPLEIKREAFDIVGEKIIRMETSFLLKDGSFSIQPNDSPELISSIFITVAIINPQNILNITENDVASITLQLSDSNTQETPLTTWRKIQETASSPLLKKVLLYQRAFHVR